MDNSKKQVTFGRPFQIFTTILVSLFALAAATGILIGIIEVLTYWRYLPQREASQVDRKELTPEELKDMRISKSRIEFMPDGTIHLLYFLGVTEDELIYGYRGAPPVTCQIFDTNDKIIWEGKSPDIPYQYLGWSEDARPYLQNDYENYKYYNYRYMEFNAHQLRNFQAFSPELSQTLEIELEIPQGRLEFWKYNPSRDFLTGFKAMGPKIGYLSASGYSESEGDIKPFGKFGCIKEYTDAVLWQTDKRLYEIDLDGRQVEVLFESNTIDIESFSTRSCLPAGVSNVSPYLKLYNENCRPFIDCKLNDKSHHLILFQPESNVTINLPQEWENWYEARVEFTATKDAIFLHRRWSKLKPPPTHSRDDYNNKELRKWRLEIRQKPLETIDEIYKLNEDGSLVLLNSFSRIRPAQKFQKQIPTIAESAQAILCEFSSPLYYIINNKFEDKISDGMRSNNGLITVTSAMISELHPNKIVPNLLLSGIFVLAALWHGWSRRSSSPKLIGWLVLVGLFNLAGFLSYLALNHTPVIKCPACGKKRNLEIYNCIHCGRPLPGPEGKPTDLITAN